MRLRLCVALALVSLAKAAAEERIERFDKDPGWDGRNHRVGAMARPVHQDFGFSQTAHAGGTRGEIGGTITTAAESCYYGKRLGPTTFGDKLTASGRLLCQGRQCHALIGFFNSRTVNEWRTPNTIAIRIHGRGEVFYAYVEYATSRWRAGGDSPGGFATVRDAQTGRLNLRGFATNASLRWSLKYDPDGNHGSGSITVQIGTESAVCHLDVGHKSDGATFDRFGILPVLKSADDAGELWLDDVAVNGQNHSFDSDPGWDGVGNRRTYQSTNVRPWFDFGFSATQFAGGRGRGELGGLVFRGDCRYPSRLACYGDRLAPLTLEKPLNASGKISLRRAVSDSTTLLGFYHSTQSMAVNPAQDSGIPRSFLGVAVEGPSRSGFHLYPIYRVHGDGQGYATGASLPHILPNGAQHEWSLRYDPEKAEGRGQIAVLFDGKRTVLDLAKGHRATGAAFDRFGLITTWIDGNGQHVYFDDLSYTWKQ